MIQSVLRHLTGVIPLLENSWLESQLIFSLERETDIRLIVQAVSAFSVHFWKKLQFFAQMISNMYSSDPDIAQSILTWLRPN